MYINEITQSIKDMTGTVQNCTSTVSTKTKQNNTEWTLTFCHFVIYKFSQFGDYISEQNPRAPQLNLYKHVLKCMCFG